ncbi:28S ribosomal protein S15, mitochondrial [Trichinella pseudospiralis]|uniref:28S ribosomal protein S15, mitochondrial n=1 Tax=Trichinella pseudospiralis TaxID=6337 RepID=A0A0V1F4V3_TRIPS|nr:28S ribosomal protein S15, mitochondrial [Trichinella pseudospiralis]
MSFSWFVQSRFLSFSCFMHTRFKWYNIRRPATDTKQADPAYYENLALSVPLAQGYIERLGEIWFEMVSVSRDVNFKRDDFLIKHDSTHWLPHVDIKQPKAEYESVKALETAPESVKKLFSIEFGCRKDLTFQWKRSLMNKNARRAALGGNDDFSVCRELSSGHYSTRGRLRIYLTKPSQSVTSLFRDP